MPRRKTEEEQLAELEKKKSQLDARIQKKRAAVKASQRKQDPRRKIIGGSICETHAEMHPDSDFAKEYRRLIAEHVVRPEDRKLFGLE